MTTVESTSNKLLYAFSHLQYEYLLAGMAGGTISTLILHPLDLLKVRFAGNFLLNIVISTTKIH